MPNKIALFTFLWPQLTNLITLNRPTKNKAIWKKLIGILDLKYQQFCTFFLNGRIRIFPFFIQFIQLYKKENAFYILSNLRIKTPIVIFLHNDCIYLNKQFFRGLTI